MGIFVHFYREIKEKYGTQLVSIRKRIAAAATISPPEHPFYPATNCLSKQLVHSRCNALHKVTPADGIPGKFKVERREIVGWKGLSMSNKEIAEGSELPEMLRYGERTVRELDHSLLAMAIREEAILSKYPLPTLVIAFALWSDSCDPNGMSKNTRGSVWALLLTLCCRVGNVNPFSYTYLVAVGESVSWHYI